MTQVLTRLTSMPEQMYNLVYVCNGQKIETVARNKPRGIVKWLKRIKTHSQNYKNGILIIEKVK